MSYPSVARINEKIKRAASSDKFLKSSRPRKLNKLARDFIESQMRQNDEATSHQIQKKLSKRGVQVHSSRAWRPRKEQGWTLQNAKYSRLVRDVNKVKRLEFAQRVIDTEDTFENVIFSDECSISLQQFRRTCYRKIGEPPKRKPKPKHLLKLHVKAGISRHGATNICIFEGIMEADLYYCNILEDALIPFIRETLPNHRFMQDNDHNYTSRVAKAVFEENNINWWRTPPESPCLNPIEDLWHELKYFLDSKVKRQTKQELVEEIKKYWSRVLCFETSCGNLTQQSFFTRLRNFKRECFM